MDDTDRAPRINQIAYNICSIISTTVLRLRELNTRNPCAEIVGHGPDMVASMSEPCLNIVAPL